MGAVPKKRISKQRKNNRRSHDALKSVNLVKCDNCDEYKVQHEICNNCGKYKGQEIL